MSSAGFVHLHVHSAYSLLKGSIKIQKLGELAKADRQPALALTDTDNMFGALEFSDKMAGYGIQPIIGCELAVDFGDQDPSARNALAAAPARIVLLAARERGYRSLMRLNSRAFLETPVHQSPHIKFEWLQGDAEDLIALTGGPEGPIALVEVQAYVFAAKKMIARVARRLGREQQADALDKQADDLAERFNAAFWCEDIGTYALALDGQKNPCRVRSSNAGQLLFSGMVSPERARLVATDLMRPHFFTGWGIRTVAQGEARFNPMSYHNGSIWPHDNALIALGFARYGLKHSVAHLFKAMFDAASYMDLRRLPELFCGFRREKRRGPTLYPVACAPQAWASATPFTLLEAALGLEFDARRGEVRLRNPRLPAFLNEVVMRDLRLGPSSVDLRVSRHGDEVSLEVLRTRGQVQVSIVLAH